MYSEGEYLQKDSSWVYVFKLLPKRRSRKQGRFKQDIFILWNIRHYFPFLIVIFIAEKLLYQRFPVNFWSEYNFSESEIYCQCFPLGCENLQKRAAFLVN